MGIHLKSAELKALQSQINPHFLYNTLEMVNWLAYGGRAEDIHTAVISLSKYYRLILNKGQGYADAFRGACSCRLLY